MTTAIPKPNAPPPTQGLSSATHQRVRKPSFKASYPTHPSVAANPELSQPSAATEELQAAFQKELEVKEGLYALVQDRDQQLLNLNDHVLKLRNSLAAAEKQLLDAFNEQSRMEEELCAHHAVSEKLREQLKEIEKEKRDLHRRYQEQVKSFEAERQSFYDNEQHLKSRIRSLTQARLRSRASPGSLEAEEVHDPVSEERKELIETSSVTVEDDSVSRSPEDHEDCDTPEVSALKLELSTLSTSYSSLQNTVQHLQTQVADLQRVNNQLQDENESYNILLREKTMAGQFDVLKQLYSTASGDHDDDAERNIDGRSIRSTARSTLGRVSELDELETTEEAQHETDDFDPFNERPPSGASKRRARSGATSPIPHGESLAGLPLTGPGLDLAAELGRAENRDGLDIPLLDAKESPAKSKSKRITRLAESADRGEEVNSLRNEVKSLKDANKALSLYASKILDRIIAQEGFEHVLAVDYKEQPASPVDRSPKPSRKSRPQSALFSLGNSLANSPKPGTSTRETTSSSTGSASAFSPVDESKRQRRSMSFDWRSLSSWGSSDKKPEPKNLRPLTLRPGATQIVGAKKLDTEEDDEDRRERERLAATMKLMGIDPPLQSPQVATDGGNWSSKTDAKSEKSSGNATSANRRWSFFRSGGAPAPVVESSKLTENALQQAEANEALRQLDEKEHSKIEYMAKGAGGGYTEPKSRRSVSDEWRSRRDARHANGSSGSASTIWSAGISNKDDRGTKNSVHDSP